MLEVVCIKASLSYTDVWCYRIFNLYYFKIDALLCKDGFCYFKDF